MRLGALVPLLILSRHTGGTYELCPHSCVALERPLGEACWMEDKLYTFDTYETLRIDQAARRTAFHPDLTGDASDRFGNSEDWYYRNGSTPSDGTGPEGDHTSGQGHYFAVEGSHPHGLGEVWMDSPLIISNWHRQGCELTFWLHANGIASHLWEMNIYIVPCDDTSSPQLLSVVGARTHPDLIPSTKWRQWNLTLPQNISRAYYIRWAPVYYIRGQWASDWSIDDVRLTKACFPPTPSPSPSSSSSPSPSSSPPPSPSSSSSTSPSASPSPSSSSSTSPSSSSSPSPSSFPSPSRSPSLSPTESNSRLPTDSPTLSPLQRLLDRPESSTSPRGGRSDYEFPWICVIGFTLFSFTVIGGIVVLRRRYRRNTRPGQVLV